MEDGQFRDELHIQFDNAKGGLLPSVLLPLFTKMHFLMMHVSILVPSLRTDNKCKYVFGLLGYLVLKGKSRRITIAMLPTGHTHEDIDALFRQIADELAVNAHPPSRRKSELVLPRTPADSERPVPRPPPAHRPSDLATFTPSWPPASPVRTRPRRSAVSSHAHRLDTDAARLPTPPVDSKRT